jgi:hypothetical protein
VDLDLDGDDDSTGTTYFDAPVRATLFDIATTASRIAPAYFVRVHIPRGHDHAAGRTRFV